MNPALNIPKGRGEEAAAYLHAHEIESRPGLVRASDYETLNADPFQYYLKIRLGLTHPWKVSEALSHGTWYHEALCLKDPTITPTGSYAAKLSDRLSEIATAMIDAGLSSERVEQALNDERRRAQEALLWAEALRDLCPCGAHSEYVTMGREIPVRVPNLSRGLPDIVCQFDEVLLDHKVEKFYIVDDKTTALPVSHRMFTCPFEFQTRLYSYAASKWARTNPELEGFTLGGVIHRVLRKPTIRFGMNDRRFTISTRELKSGPRKGQTVVEKEYSGDPDPAVYAQRVRDWFKAEGDFLDKKADHELDPPINLSITFTPPDFWDEPEFWTQLARISDFATCPTYPWLFPRNARNLLAPGPLSVYAPFYTNPVHRWPEIIKTEGFVQHWRDVPASTDTLE